MVSINFYPFLILPLASLILSFIITVRVSTKLDTRARQYFFITSVILIFWSIGEFLYPSVTDGGLSKVILNYTYVLIGMMPFFFGMSMISLYRKPRNYEVLFLMLSMMIIPVIAVMPFNVEPSDFGWEPVYTENLVYPVWMSFLSLAVMYSCAYMVKLMMTLKDDKSKRRVMYMLAGTVFGITFGVGTVIVNILFKLAPASVGSFGLVVFLFFMFLAYFR